MDKKSAVIENRKQKLSDLKNNNINLYPNDFVVLHTVRDIMNTVEGSPESLTPDTPVFVVAGRMMAVNRFGKAAFIRFRDYTGQLQAYVRKDKIGDETFRLFNQMDIGDFVGLKGGMFKTRTGEWTLLVNELKLVCKSIRPLPEKFHGLKDPEKRYRRRFIKSI